MSDLTELKSYLGDTLISRGNVDFLGTNQTGFPQDLQFFREDVRAQVEHITGSIFRFLIVTCADTLRNIKGNKTITLFQNNEWDELFLKGLNFRLGSVFMTEHFIGDSGIGSTLLQYMKEHKIMLLRENVELRYTENDDLVVHKFAESSPLEQPHTSILGYIESEVVDLASLK